MNHTVNCYKHSKGTNSWEKYKKETQIKTFLKIDPNKHNFLLQWWKQSQIVFGY